MSIKYAKVKDRICDVLTYGKYEGYSIRHTTETVYMPRWWIQMYNIERIQGSLADRLPER